MKQLLKYLAFCTIAVLLNSCNDSESDLLEAKVYFESKEHTIEVLAYIIHSGFISGYQNRYGDNLKPPTNVYHRMTA